MKIFSTFSGIGGFEIGIQNAFDNRPDIRNGSEVLHGNSADTSESPLRFVGYSEIDKYAIKVYEKQFKQPRGFTEREEELSELRTNISNKNYDIISIWKQNYVNAEDHLKTNRLVEELGLGVGSAGTSITATDTSKTQKLKSALRNKRQTLSDETQKKLSNILSDIMLCEDSECLICMDANVFVAESLKKNSSRSNTETETDISTESDTELAICINSPSKFTTQKNTKSYATTVITLKEGTAYAHISREKPIRNFGDITKINAEELPDFDCLVGGFPCQAFSIAGKRKGFEDTRGTLFFDLARILRAKQPRLFVFENVKGLLSHDSGRTFKTIIQTIDELGYDCQWQVLNSKNHGVPQNRERVYIVGHLRGTARPEVFPISGTDQEDTRIVGQDVAYTIDANYAKGTNTLSKGRRSVVAEIAQLNNPTHSNDRVYASDGISPTLNTMQGGNRQPFVSDPPKIRRLTPLECERLQGFPDNWTAEGIDGPISDTQRYKMCGNAVTTNVVQAIFERIFNND